MDKARILAASGIEILERDGDTISAEVQTEAGVVTIVAELVFVEDALVLDGVHVDGRGLTRTNIRQLAKVFGEVEDVVEVIIQGGIRTSGARRGFSSLPIRVEVKR